MTDTEITGTGAVNKQVFCGRNVGKFMLYLAVIGLCLATILYMLMHAKPSIAPAVKDGSRKSGLSSPTLVLPSWKHRTLTA
jgi:hypothetical protein